MELTDIGRSLVTSLVSLYAFGIGVINVDSNGDSIRSDNSCCSADVIIVAISGLLNNNFKISALTPYEPTAL